MSKKSESGLLTAKQYRRALLAKTWAARAREAKAVIKALMEGMPAIEEEKAPISPQAGGRGSRSVPLTGIGEIERMTRRGERTRRRSARKTGRQYY